LLAWQSQTFFAIPQFDPTVAPSQSWRFADKLKKLGVEVETGRAKDGLHCYDRKVRLIFPSRLSRPNMC
jgi:hypothetical protein